MKSRISKSMAITFIAVSMAYFIAVSVEILTGKPLGEAGMLVAILIPLVIGFPVLLLIEGQNDRLRDAFQEMDRLHRIAREQIKLDSMTGLFNHQHFMEAIHNGATGNDSDSLIILDVDHFKNINDSWGHQKGDEALLSIVDAIRSTVRSTDIVGRIGGEEFAVYFPNTTREEAKVAAARIREMVENIIFEPQKGTIASLTVSIGGAFRHEAKDMGIAMRLADLRMYAAKKSGRNKVVFSGERLALER